MNPHSPNGRVLVANPGHLPWMVHVAARLHETGALGRYFSPAAFTPQQIEALARLPRPLGQKLASELRRRAVPQALAKASVETAGSLAELMYVLAARANASEIISRRLADWRDARFDRAVALELDQSIHALLVAYMAAEKTIATAKRLDAFCLLDHPVAHHDFDARILREEQRLVPEWAGTMQFHDPTPERQRRLDTEIAAVDQVLALSAFHERTFLEAGVEPRKMLRVPPLGVDGERFRPASREGSDVFRVLYVGQLTQRKGLSYLVDAFERAAIPGSELLLAGAPVGSMRPWAGRRRVSHIPLVAPSETPALYQRADVMVLPSISDAAPRVTLEAMASGLPVIVTENAGSSEVIDDGRDGFIVPIRDADAIAERLRALAADPDRRRSMGGRARETALSYPWEKYADTVARALTRGLTEASGFGSTPLAGGVSRSGA